MLTSNHIEVLADYVAYGIRETSIVFFVVNKPERGELTIETTQRRENNVFTLHDLKQVYNFLCYLYVLKEDANLVVAFFFKKKKKKKRKN